jgi:hypothetical protein
MKQVGSPAADAAFYRGVFAGLPASGAPLSVLISGSSDHGILEQVLSAAGGRPLEITVTDACQTPLELNRWYAERAGIAVSTQRSNIIDFKADRPFDLVFAHGFIEQLPPERRPALAALWHRWLVPGGLAVVVSMIRNAQEAEVERNTASRAADARALVEQTNALLAPALRLPVDATLARLERFWETRAPSNLRSEEEITAMLAGAGFTPGPAAEGFADVPGRGGLKKSRRVRIAARR